MRAIPAILCLSLVSCWQTGSTGNDQERFHPYTRHIDFEFNSAVTGATAPTSVTIGTRRCLQFTQATAAETAYALFEIPEDWDEASDMTVELYVYPVAGDAPQLNEVIQFTANYKVNINGQAYDKASTSVAVTYTETANPGVDKGRVELSATIDYDDATNPLVCGAHVGFEFDLHEVNTTYSGNPYLCDGEVKYQSVKLPYN